ncbi:sulfotransferase domain-containing protein [Roseospira marina]|uniref:Sulfotransferase domain-containing protein n=1 Tax=Roseospira marina TaxID=140057 RepID=A0A5M6I815_9PROT|nr:sulfotransferase domain-containing protein [Roseospira marina]KAA5604047.1 sulfotransferase domain-containing protein [Roseospira marina]MBB4315841.1 hypothetical protein [Roseospira marina]MBB5089019.1 hypothetical protein [Roseospira marina]
MQSTIVREYMDLASNVTYWGRRLAFDAPKLAGRGLGAFVRTHVRVGAGASPDGDTQILVGTHHKVLTVFFNRTFRTFGFLTNRRVSSGTGDALRLDADIILDHHAYFRGFQPGRPFRGLHVIRDPRDVLVSSANYHLKSAEGWLHVRRPEFGDQTYQEHIRSLPTMEARLLFEIDHASGETIRDMHSWYEGRPGFRELRYEDLVTERAVAEFSQAVADWPLSDKDRDLLIAVFDYFSIRGRGSRRNAHIRNPSPGQWRQHFTPPVLARFTEAFGPVVEDLGYTW